MKINLCFILRKANFLRQYTKEILEFYLHKVTDLKNDYHLRLKSLK